MAAAGLAATLLLGACSSSGSSSDGGGNVTLSYGLWDKNQVPAMKRIAAAYHATHKNVTVNVQLTPYDGYFTKLQTAAGGGQAPDVFWMNGPNFQLYASNGVLAPLTGSVDTKPYPASLVKLYQYDGKQYGLPKDFDTVGLWYNKKLFDAAGLKYPDATWTWQTFQDAAKKLTVPSKGQFGTSALLTGQEGMYNTIYQAGGYIVSPDGKKSGYDSPQAIKGLEFWTNLIKEKVSPDQKQMTDTAPYQMFEAGKIAMYWGGSWDAVEFGNNALTKAQADVSVLPAGAQRATVIHGLANVVFARSKHKAQAIDFAKFLGSKQAAEIEGSTGTVIPAYTGTQDAWIKAHPQFHLQSFLDELPYSQPYPVSANTAAWNTLETDILTKAWSGQEPVDKAAHELADGMNKVLAKEGK
jgi:multiple sugar transport system substrate-binding protein